MKQKITLLFLLLSAVGVSAQITKIDAKDGVHYITTEIKYPITGTYQYQGGAPTVELNGGGSGYYQLHDQEKRPVIWGIECDESGQPKFKKGFDNAAYTLWYQYTSPNAEVADDANWKPVGFSVHFNSQKMYIQGERMKTYGGEAERK